MAAQGSEASPRRIASKYSCGKARGRSTRYRQAIRFLELARTQNPHRFADGRGPVVGGRAKGQRVETDQAARRPPRETRYARQTLRAHAAPLVRAQRAFARG